MRPTSALKITQYLAPSDGLSTVIYCGESVQIDSTALRHIGVNDDDAIDELQKRKILAFRIGKMRTTE